MNTLHINAVDVSFVPLDVAVPLALEVTLIALEPLHVDVVNGSFMLLRLPLFLLL